MKKPITIPTDDDVLISLIWVVERVKNDAGTLSRYEKPYDQILVLKQLKKDITKVLKETGN